MDLTPSFPKHKKRERHVLLPSSQNQSLLSSTEGFQAGCSGAPRVENPTAPSARPAVGPPGAAVREQGPLPGWEPEAEGPTTPPEAQKGSVPPPLSHLQAGNRRNSGPDNSSFFAEELRQGTTPALPLRIPLERGWWACFPVCVLACSCVCHF